MPLTLDELAYMRATQTDHRPISATLLAQGAGSSDGLGGWTEVALTGIPITIRVSGSEDIPTEIGARYGPAVVKIALDVGVDVRTGDTIGVDPTETYDVVSDGDPDRWATGQTVWAQRSTWADRAEAPALVIPQWLLSGSTVTLSITAVTPVARVEYRVDGDLIGSWDEAPWDVPWALPTVTTDTDYALTVDVTRPDGTASQDSATVTVMTPNLMRTGRSLESAADVVGIEDYSGGLYFSRVASGSAADGGYVLETALVNPTDGSGGLYLEIPGEDSGPVTSGLGAIVEGSKIYTAHVAVKGTVGGPWDAKQVDWEIARFNEDGTYPSLTERAPVSIGVAEMTGYTKVTIWSDDDGASTYLIESAYVSHLPYADLQDQIADLVWNGSPTQAFIPTPPVGCPASYAPTTAWQRETVTFKTFPVTRRVCLELYHTGGAVPADRVQWDELGIWEGTGTAYRPALSEV